MNKDLIGREAEIRQLESIQSSKEAEFVVVYGRRRVGKTFLVNSFFDNQYAFKLTGLSKKSKSEQLSNFSNSLNNQCGSKAYRKPRTWYEAFDQLRDFLQKIKSKQKRVVFIDELPWMDTRGGNLISALEHFWNDWASVQKDIILVVCGSATSWITKKILKNKGGLHNRVTQKIYVRPFTLAECKKYILSQGIQMEDKDIAECYMIMGGIPYYLKNLRHGASLYQNIDEMFFKKRGRLDDEFESLYASLFDSSENYIKVVEALSSKKKGLTRDEILEATKLESNGHFSAILNDLIDCDFVRYYNGFEKKVQKGLYQLVDPFTLFYYKFIRNHVKTEKPFWLYQIGTREHDVWAGLAFEQLCLNHHNQIEKALGISGIITNVFSWISPSSVSPKAQIDLVIKRADKVINLCEMKFYSGLFTPKKKDYNDMERKIKVFRETNEIRQALIPVLVTPQGVAKNQYSEIFQNVVTLKDLFE